MTLGKEEKGNAIAADTANADPITTTSGICICTPILAIIGIRMIDATVCDTNVAIVPQNNKMYKDDTHGLSTGKDSDIPIARYASNPEESTAFPSTLPPPTRIKVCHDRELKSTSESIPDPNITATKHREMIAMSPNISLVSAEVANRRIVNRDNTITAMFRFPITLLRSYTITGIDVTSSGFSTTMINNQHSTVHSREKGRATAIQVPNDTAIPACSKYVTARAFCRLEMGVIIPPKLHENANPNSRAFENLDSVGRSLTMGRMIVAQRIGAVWLDIHIERNRPNSMTASMNNLGYCPRRT